MKQQYQKTIAGLNAMVDQEIVPGISYVLFDHDQEYRKVKGLAEVRPDKKQLRVGMQYDLASLTKVIGTVPVIAMALQTGELTLNDPVQKYLAEFSDPRPTIRHLLTHTSGICGYIPHRDELSATKLKRAYLTHQHVDESFNRQIRYADVNFLYLGWIAEKIFKKPIQQLITEKVLEPLKMVGATFKPFLPNTVPTEIQPQRGLIRGVAHDPKAYILGEKCGCAGLFASLDDLVMYSRALIETNLNDLLEVKIIDQMFKDQTLIPGEHSRSLGWKLLHATNDRHLIISHTGFTGTWLILDKKEDQGMIVLTNRVHPHAKNDDYLWARDQLFATYLHEKENA
ncbi:serine hydrolase domain-containing protein [Limosilactobacillus fastidiosus]|uniref:Beta-lactamase family protein n=1 Tax=Limosilactobacillus fastidiosus TaxID=2759855 RepID=A0A7W3TYQ0_9LACO|nr:serine hydrolase domain-containing protein [Limosilactobacillus fastidiosus]MBB1085733.1 beta-lactamase family protein [Limosilactobacillus fastidiosus]MCD7086105.1 beta-lactamase family protein [Limosilactobacillus fastidiosus]MCD7114623.1 beta-lactamase family protein [Limosilactobacillus fastidiosus]MCD7115905.1 beta-lactamase family protein [Limosilactobacillus fastidiosus]